MEAYDASTLGLQSASCPGELLATQLLQFLGASRCRELRGTCQAWRSDLSTSTRRSGGAACPRGEAVLDAMRAPCFQAPASVMSLEDDVFLALTESTRLEDTQGMLLNYSRITDYEEISDMIAALKQKCTISPEAVSSIFQYQFERSKTFYLSPRAIHYAVIHSASRVVKMLLSAAKRAGVLEQVLQLSDQGDRPLTVTPLFLAVLFAEADVVEMLKSWGCKFNRMDGLAAMRLLKAGHWKACQSRIKALGLDAELMELEDGFETYTASIDKARMITSRQASPPRA
eukprot:TRINITY_DN46262_c0_g1_i1.p1 TRINITY_DN46262_c0_g1~~TRINITY_DN46262_c0_g1_i1.p1  ORF type:complete len:286 (-),score=40.27 TRINITY_DN46262_c0_g1_i1:445-1302(-)